MRRRRRKANLLISDGLGVLARVAQRLIERKPQDRLVDSHALAPRLHAHLAVLTEQLGEQLADVSALAQPADVRVVLKLSTRPEATGMASARAIAPQHNGRGFEPAPSQPDLHEHLALVRPRLGLLEQDHRLLDLALECVPVGPVA